MPSDRAMRFVAELFPQGTSTSAELHLAMRAAELFDKHAGGEVERPERSPRRPLAVERRLAADQVVHDQEHGIQRLIRGINEKDPFIMALRKGATVAQLQEVAGNVTPQAIRTRILRLQQQGAVVDTERLEPGGRGSAIVGRPGTIYRLR